jgi:membrane protein
MALFRALRVPLSWTELAKRTFSEVVADNCLGLAAELAYYFVLALFPALLFLVAIISFIPVTGLLDAITSSLARIAPYEALKLIQDQVLSLAGNKNGGLLTLGMLGTLWSTSSGVNAIIDTLNTAYDIQESRPWWRVKLLALGLTVALAVFVVVSTVLVLVGPTLAEKIAEWVHLGAAFTWTWKILQWPVVFALVSLAIAIVYYWAPDAEQYWVWITPGSLLATFVWLAASLLFKLYVSKFGSYNATYGTIAGIIILMTWFYVSGLAVLVGAELNSEIEHASPYGKDPGEKVLGAKKEMAAAALAAPDSEQRAETPTPPAAPPRSEVERVPPLAPPAPRRARAHELIVGLLALAEAAMLAYRRLQSRSRQRLRQ